MEKNDLIERYIAEVGDNLPRKIREDIQLELRSLLYDDLEERAGGQEVTREMTADMLRDYGNPESIALRYQPERYLIGPALFPAYRVVIMVVSMVIFVVFLIPVIITLFTGGLESWGSWIFATFWDFFQVLLMNLAGITLIFAAVEKVQGEKLALSSEGEEDWDPYQLAPVKNPNRIKRGELIAGIAFSASAIVIFNFFPHWFSMVNNPDARVIIPILTEEFMAFVPLLTVYWALEIAFRIILLRQGEWRTWTRWSEFALGLFGLMINYQILTNGPITTFAWLNILIRLGIGIGLVVGVIESVMRLIRIFRPPQTAPEDLVPVEEW